MHLPIHEKQERGFVKWNKGTLLHLVLLVATNGWLCVLLVATKRHRLNLGFTAFIKTLNTTTAIFINDAVVLAI